MAKLHFFNPGHETAVRQGLKNYTPSANVRRMTRELASLPMWYADADDFVFTETLTEDATFFESEIMTALQLPATRVSRKEIEQKKCLRDKSLETALWGLSPHDIHRFDRLKADCLPNLSVPVWNDAYKQLTGRQTTLACLALLQKQMPPTMLLPEMPVFCENLREVEQYMNIHTPPFVVKTPFSSSGRGLLWLNGSLTNKEMEWIGGALKKQNAVSIEPALDKLQDFAMEFYSDGNGTVTYEGLSVFQAEQRGAYSGNRLGDPMQLEAPFKKRFGNAFTQINKAVQNALSQLYGSVYTGYLGVDMLVYRHGTELLIHPCVEINMRYTMGLVALRISQKHITHGSHGTMSITFDARPGEARRQHLRMQTTHPAVIENHRIRKGYLSLCPVTEETRYRAYILLSDSPQKAENGLLLQKMPATPCISD